MITVNKEELLNAIKVCEKATAKNAPYKPELMSILFEYNKETLHLVSTDACRLHRAEVEITDRQETEKFEVMLRGVHIKPAEVFVKSVDDECVEIECKDGTLMFTERTSGSAASMHLPTLQGRFPDYQKIIPETNKECLILKQSLIDTIKSGGAKAADIKKRRVVFAGDTVKIEQSQTHNWNNAETIKEVPVASVLKTKEKIDVILSAQYLYEAIGAYT